MEKSIIFTKEIDWSTLNYGFNIPVEMQEALYQVFGRRLSIGEGISIPLTIAGVTYTAKLTNSAFDRDKFSNHPTEIVRVMYTRGSGIPQALQTLFSECFHHMVLAKENAGPRKHISIPQDLRQNFVLSYHKGIFEIEPLEKVDKEICRYVNELDFETSASDWVDPNAGIEIRNQLIKIRKIDQSIGSNLKILYRNKCQVTGEEIGSKYGTSVVEAHHIGFFIDTLNNDSSNLVILSPTFHRIIHKTKPFFNWSTLSFEFPNGVIEPLRINYHLKRKVH